MCSTPRASASIKKVHHIPTSRAHFKSHAQMIHRASQIYDRKQEEKAKQQQKQDNLNDDSSKEVVSIQQSVEKIIPVMENISQFIALIRSKIPPIVTT